MFFNKSRDTRQSSRIDQYDENMWLNGCKDARIKSVGLSYIIADDGFLDEPVLVLESRKEAVFPYHKATDFVIIQFLCPCGGKSKKLRIPYVRDRRDYIEAGCQTCGSGIRSIVHFPLGR